MYKYRQLFHYNRASTTINDVFNDDLDYVEVSLNSYSDNTDENSEIINDSIHPIMSYDLKPFTANEIQGSLHVLDQSPDIAKKLSNRITGRDDLFTCTTVNCISMLNDICGILNNPETILAAQSAISNLDCSVDMLSNINIRIQGRNPSLSLYELDEKCETIARSALRSSKTHDELLSQHKCVFCQDVCAAPVITNCNHSFCGVCLDKEMKSSQNATCPICRSEITAITYELQLDESISKDMNNLAIYEIDKKADWDKRRSTYLSSKGYKKKNEIKSDDNDPFYTMYSFPVNVAVVAVIVFVMINLVRKGKVD